MTDEPTYCGTCNSRLRHVRLGQPWGSFSTVPCADPWHDVEQLELDMAPFVKPVYVEGATIQERFEHFASLNSWVYDALERLTADYIDRGAKRVGMKMLCEVLRWNYGRQTQGEKFKINNDYTSRYARLLVRHHPEWSGVFETRELTAA